MVDFANPTNSTAYANVLSEIRDAIAAAISLAPSGGSNIPTGAIQAVVADGKFQRYSGGSFSDWLITANGIAASVAGNGLAGGAGSALSVNVDDSTIEINSDALRLKDRGIAAAKLASDAVETAKIKDLNVTTGKLAADAVTTAKFLGANNAYLRWRNAADSADVSVLKIDSGDATLLNAASGKRLYLTHDGNAKWYMDASNYGWIPYTNAAIPIGGTSNRVSTIHLAQGIEMPVNSVAAAASPATQIAANGFSIISSGGASRAVRLPAATLGDICILCNTSSQTVLVNTKNASSDYVNGDQPADGTLGMTAKATWILWCYQANRWAALS